MSQAIKLYELKNLYTLKALGFGYEESSSKADIHFSRELPNDFNQLIATTQACSLCELAKNRKQAIIPSVVDPKQIKVLFVVDPPSVAEDEQNRPVTAKVAQMLENIVANVLELQPHEIYVTNAVKCRVNSSNILNENILSLCKPYLFKQMELLTPKVIVPLGHISYNQLIHNGDEFEVSRGKTLKLDQFVVVPSYSLTHLLRNPSAKKDAHRDMLLVKEHI
jgi:uracil-DNA glycosylase family 4